MPKASEQLVRAHTHTPCTSTLSLSFSCAGPASSLNEPASKTDTLIANPGKK